MPLAARALAAALVVAATLIDGIFELVASLSRSRSNRGLLAVSGVVSVVIGILLIRHPVGGVTAIALFIGIARFARARPSVQSSRAMATPGSHAIPSSPRAERASSWRATLTAARPSALA